MRLFFAVAAAGSLFPLGLLGAAIASADTDSIADVGNDNLGYSVGTTGGSLAIGGTRTTVDGFGTLHGSTTITRGDTTLFGISQSYDKGFESTTTVGDSSQTTELKYGTAEWSWNTPNGSFELYCTPDKGCTTE